MCWLRCRLSFAIIRSAIMCVRGSRSSHHRPRCEIDITLATRRVSSLNRTLCPNSMYIFFNFLSHLEPLYSCHLLLGIICFVEWPVMHETRHNLRYDARPPGHEITLSMSGSSQVSLVPRRPPPPEKRRRAWSGHETSPKWTTGLFSWGANFRYMYFRSQPTSHEIFRPRILRSVTCAVQSRAD